jgi:hypothetical protein
LKLLFGLFAEKLVDGDFADEIIIYLTLNNAMVSAKKGEALIAGCSPAVSLANFGYD